MCLQGSDYISDITRVRNKAKNIALLYNSVKNKSLTPRSLRLEVLERKAAAAGVELDRRRKNRTADDVIEAIAKYRAPNLSSCEQSFDTRERMY